MINFPTKKYLKSSDYFDDYISTKDFLLKKIDQNILNKAVALHDGINLVDKDNKREDLIYAISRNELINSGLEDTKDIYSQAIKRYKKDKNTFYTDFNIKDELKKIIVKDEKKNNKFKKQI